MEVNEAKKDVKKKVLKIMEKKKLLIFGVVCIAILIFILLIVTSKEGSVEFKVKTSLDRIVEKGDLETVNFTYNVIGKQCKKKDNCDKKSNDIDNFEYVVSCKGTVTAGINFEKIEIVVDESEKKLLVKIPAAEVKDINVGSIKFLNGEDLPASELANARKLCDETIEEKSKSDDELLSAAKEQAEVVLESFYGQWVKAFDEEYEVEVK